MNLIKLEQVEKDYMLGHTRIKALGGVNLTIEKGEFTVISGPSGSGKTTLLNIIGCLDNPSSGTYNFDGSNVASIDIDELATIRNLKIGFVFQHFNLIPVLNVLENIEFPLLIRSSANSVKQQRKQVLELAERLGLENHLKHRPDELSGGQRQRVSIARALVTRPRIVLADEPTANLDSKTAETIIQLMRDLHQNDGMTFIFSTHDSRVLRHADRIIELVDGKLLAA